MFKFEQESESAYEYQITVESEEELASLERSFQALRSTRIGGVTSSYGGSRTTLWVETSCSRSDIRTIVSGCKTAKIVTVMPL